MYIIKGYWAGHFILSCELKNDKEVVEKIEDLKMQLKKKELVLLSCGHSFVLTELCVDIVQYGSLVAVHNLKK